MSRIIPQMHKDRYRQIFCAEDFYMAQKELFKMWKTRFSNLTNVEKVLAWVVALSCLRRPTDWYGGQRQNKFMISTEELKHSIDLKTLFQDSPIRIPNKINPEINLIDFINEVRIKALPESCHRSMCFLTNQKYPLLVTESIPTPQQLLKIQITGKRIISINEDYEDWASTLYSGRDFLGFIIHDLIHADHFFYNPEHRNAQLGFFTWVETILLDQSLVGLLNSKTFTDGFEYIISDMNSHPVHLFQTLKTLLFIEIKNDEQSNKIWSDWLTNSNLSADESFALQQLNTKSFNSQHAKTIEILCIRLGKQKLI